MLTTAQKTALRLCALAFGLLTMAHILSPHAACAASTTDLRATAVVQAF